MRKRELGFSNSIGVVGLGRYEGIARITFEVIGLSVVPAPARQSSLIRLF